MIMRERRLPFTSIPTGWFPVLHADELPQGEVVPLRYFDRDLVAWRDDEGNASVFDAVCPHLGANLAYGGVVADGCLECPYHHFRFDGSGACVAVPYAKRLNKRATATNFPVLEKNQQVYVWHDAEGREPNWLPPDIEELTSEKWTGIDYRFEFRTVKTAWHEVAEQVVDRGHTSELHALDAPTFHHFTARDHVWIVDITQRGDDIPMGADGDTLHAEYHGPGIAVLHYMGSLNVVLTTTTLPITADELVLRMGVIVERRDTEDETDAIGKLVLEGFVGFVGMDIDILDHKVFLDRPALVDGDGDFMKFRKWVSQFHREPMSVAVNP
jgi:nitrite reductase/ring-hydroxylating ferredoxin subunit